MDPFFWTIAEFARNYRERRISPREVVELHLRRVQGLQPSLNAFVHVDEEGARAAARAAEDALLRGNPLGPLHGIPMTVKSCIDVANWPCPAGSLTRKDYRPSGDAPMVQRLRDAGAILLGNSNTPEFLMAYETDNRVSGGTSNPWSAAHSSGGSSGGEAAAIGAGCSAGGIGSDGGGSIRVPAHFCGICGLKPTPGRVPATGHFPGGNSAFGWLGVAGPMARTASDVRALFEVLRGVDPGDALSADVALSALAERPPHEIRIGIVESPALRATPETQQAVQKAARLLEESGHPVEFMRLAHLERMLELWWFFFGTVIGELFRGLVRGQERLLSPVFLEYMEAAKTREEISMQKFVGMCVARDAERERILRTMRDVPVLLSPVSAAPAFRHGQGTYHGENGYLQAMRHSQWLNLTGFPGMTVPMAFSPDGLPIGVQLIGRPNEEELLLRIAERLEEARGPWPAPNLA